LRCYGGSINPRADLELGDAADYALAYFLKASADEDRLGLIDYKGDEWPW